MQRMMRLFVWLVALVLLLTGLAKVGTALAGGSAYGQADVVFSFLSLRQLLLLAGLLELGCVAWLLRPGQPTGKALLILWLSSLFWVYRLGLKLAEVQGPCPCLGAVPLWTPAWAVAVDGVLLGMLVFMTVGALGSLMAAAARLWRGSDAVRSPLPAATSANGRTDARFGRRAILGWGLVVWMPSLTLAPCGSVLGQSPEAAQALATVKRFITTPPTVADMIYRVRWLMSAVRKQNDGTNLNNRHVGEITMKSTQRLAAKVLAAPALALAFFFTGTVWAEETNLFKIRYVGPDEQGRLTLKWTSRPNDVFTIWYAETLAEPIVWNVAVADYPSGGYVTSWTDLGGQGRGAPPQIPLPPSAAKFSLTEQQRTHLLERRSKLPPPPLPPDPRDPSTWRKARDGAAQESGNPPRIMRFYRVSSANWPSAVITSPPSGGTVSELLTVNATGNDDVRTVGAALLVDGIKAASVMGDSPYSFDVDTTKFLNGWHQVVVQTFDIDNHAANSPALQLRFDNLICGFDASQPAFTPNGDGLNDTARFSGSLSESAAWILRIRRRGGSVVRTFTGQGTTLNVTWDGRDDEGSFVSLGTYEYSVSADTGAGFGEGARRISETQWRRMWVDRGAPDWSAINFHSYHGVESGTLSYVLRTYFWTYLGLAPLLFEPDPNIYVHENRIWCSDLGYDGDIVPYFLDQEFYQNLRSDNLVYMMTHGAYDPLCGFTAIVDYFDNAIGGTQYIRDQWEPYNPNGFIFVQINACQSGDGVDQDGNHDLASGFGIFSNPLTVGRAYLGWRGKIHPITSGLYMFDQLFWSNMVNNHMELEDAVADAWASTIWTGGTPVIIGDPHLTLPEIW